MNARAGQFGKPIQRGSLRRLGPGALVAVAATTAVTAYFVPLLGVSLAAFLVIDVALGARQRRLAAREVHRQRRW